MIVSDLFFDNEKPREEHQPSDEVNPNDIKIIEDYFYLTQEELFDQITIIDPLQEERDKYKDVVATDLVSYMVESALPLLNNRERSYGRCETNGPNNYIHLALENTSTNTAFYLNIHYTLFETGETDIVLKDTSLTYNVERSEQVTMEYANKPLLDSLTKAVESSMEKIREDYLRIDI